MNQDSQELKQIEGDLVYHSNKTGNKHYDREASSRRAAFIIGENEKNSPSKVAMYDEPDVKKRRLEEEKKDREETLNAAKKFFEDDKRKKSECRRRKVPALDRQYLQNMFSGPKCRIFMDAKSKFPGKLEYILSFVCLDTSL